MPALLSGIVTFLLTDIEGSTSIWERHPDAMRSAMARHDALVTTGIERHGGVVVKSRGEGDSVFAVFTRADAAVTAAIDVQTSLHAVVWPANARLRVRMGLHTGASELRDQDYQGSAPNRCARVRGIASGGQVLLSESTAALVKSLLPGDVSLRDLGEYQLRGFDYPERVFELVIPDLLSEAVSLGEQLGIERTGQVTALPKQLPGDIRPTAVTPAGTPEGSRPATYSPTHPFPRPPLLVGRGRELELMVRPLSGLRDGGRVTFVGGPAGIGKSALVGELLLRAQRDGLLCLVGKCYEQENTAPMTPFHDALADYLLRLPPERLQADLGAMVGGLVHLVPELHAHLGLVESARRDIDVLSIFGAVRMLLQRAAEQTPVVLCLEDVHAADEASLQLLHHLARHTPRLRLLLICTFRTEPGPASATLTQIADMLRRQGVLQELTLPPLELRSSEHLIGNLLDGQVADRLAESVFAICEGNPLFTEQLVLGLVESGSVERHGAIWQGSLESIDRPPRAVLDVIVQRLSRLTPSCRQTLQTAAVFGQSVEHAALQAALVNADDSQIVLDLEEAIDAQLLVEAGTGYRFSHALQRDAVYWELSAPRRRLLHGRAGRVLESLHGGRSRERAAELAHHFALASETRETRGKLLTYSVEAGRRAAGLSSHREALTHFTRACELIETSGRSGGKDGPSAEDWLAALEGRGGSERAMGLWEASIDSFRRALGATVDPLRLARSHAAIGYAHQRIGDSTTAMAHYHAGLAELESAREAPGVAIARLRLQSDQAYIHFLRGHFEQQLALSLQMLAPSVELGEVRAVMWAHNLTALAYMGLGNGKLSLVHFREALAAAGRTDDKVDIALARSNLGIYYQYAGQFAQARSELERAIEIHHEAAADRRAANSMQRLGRVFLAEGDVAGALEQANQALALATEVHDRWEADCLDLLGAIHGLRADWTSAQSYYRRALALRQRADHRAGLIESLLGLGLVHEQHGDWTEARSLYTSALEHARHMNPNPWLLAALRQLGRLLHRLGERETSREHLTAAASLADTMSDTVELAPLRLTLVECGWFGTEVSLALSALGRALSEGATVELAVDLYATRSRLCQVAVGPAEARADVDEALRLARQLRSPRSEAVAQLAAARQSLAEDDLRSAVPWFEAALTSARAANTPYELALVLKEYAAVGSADPGRAHVMLAEATAIFDQLTSDMSTAFARQP